MHNIFINEVDYVEMPVQRIIKDDVPIIVDKLRIEIKISFDLFCTMLSINEQKVKFERFGGNVIHYSLFSRESLNQLVISSFRSQDG